MNYHNILFYLLISGCLFPSSVSIYNAEVVARNLYSARLGTFASNELMIESVEVIKEEFEELIYLFHLDPKGFIMVSADDRSTPILAYSFENSLELEMIPPNLFWVIEKYKNNLLLQIKSNQTSSEAMQSKWKKFLHGKALFRQINNSNKILDKLSDKAVALIIKWRSEKAGIDSKKIAGHSMRSGIVTVLARSEGVTETDIKKITGHQSTSMVQKYIQDAELFDNATKKLDL